MARSGSPGNTFNIRYPSELLLAKSSHSIIIYDDQAGTAFMAEVDDGEKFALGSEDTQRPWQEFYRGLVGGVELAGDTRYIGRSVPRNDALYKVRGKAKYAANVSLPDMLHGRFVRSIHPYARIKRVDVSKAAALKGVHCVLTAEDIPDDRLLVGSLVKDTPILAKEVVRHVGEPIVAIGAETLE